MAKKKVTVNIEEKVWLEFKKMAFRSQLEVGQNPSISQYLENMISVKLKKQETDLRHSRVVNILFPDESLDSVEKTKDDLINALADENVDLDAEELKQANERLMKKRIETKKGPVKANAAMESFFNPMPKKKGAK